MCGGICTISSQILSGPAPLPHHITTHPKGILAEVAGMAEICGSGSLTFAAVRLHIQNSKHTVTAPSASHAVKNNRTRCISITCFFETWRKSIGDVFHHRCEIVKIR